MGMCFPDMAADSKKDTSYLVMMTFRLKYSRMGFHWLIFNKGLFLDEYRHGVRKRWYHLR